MPPRTHEARVAATLDDHPSIGFQEKCEIALALQQPDTPETAAFQRLANAARAHGQENIIRAKAQEILSGQLPLHLRRLLRINAGMRAPQ